MMKTNLLTLAFSTATILALTMCNAPSEEGPSEAAGINGETIADHIKILASDEFEGRKPFTTGETKTIEYIKSEFEKMGIKPGNGDSYYQKVPLVSINATVETNMTITSGSGTKELAFGSDYVALTRRVQEDISVNDSEIVFAGFGIVAPEYDWNDYEGLDVAGKTVVVLVNDPGFGTGDNTFFKGNSMTYYGRWTYKYEEAARQGAEGILIIHETIPAGYPWEVVQNGWSGSKLYLKSEDNNASRCAVEGWISTNAAAQLFADAGLPGYYFNNEARKPDFTAVSLNQTMSVSLSNTLETSESNNVIGLYEGSERSDEYIIYSGHWDHLGIGAPVEGDSIWNGAVDNATGIAAIFEIAREFTRLEEKPKRSVLFMAVTAEEQGLLGSAHYAENPIYPVTKTVANINMDAMRAIGKMKDVTVIGHGQSELDDYAAEAAATQGRYILPDTDPGKGYFFRSDHFNFAKVGIPALYAKGGYEHIENGVEWTKEQQADYTANRYHKAADEYNESWDMSGIVQDAELFFQIGLKIANEDRFPQWKEGSEFKAKRDADMAQAN